MEENEPCPLLAPRFEGRRRKMLPKNIASWSSFCTNPPMDIFSLVLIAIGVVVIGALVKVVFWVLELRRVVATNEVHIVQSAK